MADVRRRLLSVLGAGTAVAAVGAPFVPTPVVSIPVGDVVAPAVALGVVRRILRTRARQIEERRRPARLTTDDERVLAEVLRSARQATSICGSDSALAVPSRVEALLESVESTGETSAHVAPTDWSILVRLIGEPIAESRSGEQAMFGKKRAMELLSWMVLNQDRLSRSAVRNAMWDFPVADSTFGTILSDLRRGLARLAPPPSSAGWCPATLTDRLVLADGVISDVELLDAAVSLNDMNSIVKQLSGVRDVPFAGTGYLWADLDGSTTRIVITVMDAVDRVIELGRERNDTPSIVTAVRAGLRVMPGDEQLLELQRSLLSR